MQWEAVLAPRMGRMKASEIRELLKLLDQPDIISFAGGIPDPKLFPTESFRDALARALEPGKADAALQYSVSEGSMALRRWLAQHMAGLGMPCGVDNILITSGSQQALDYLGKLMIGTDDTVLVNWPTYLGALGAFNAYEPRYDRLDPGSNREAADFAQTAKAAGGKPKFIYLSVDFANPTGETLDRAQRDRVLTLAEELDCAIVEDAAYQALRYDGEPIPPILALEIAQKGNIDACRTIYCGSFSKTLAPGLRVGWIVAASDVIRRLVLMKQAADLHSSTLNQIAVADVAERVFESHVAGLRAVYRQRRDAMLAALDREMPEGVRWKKPEGGMFVWITLPEGMDGAALLARAIQTERVAFVPGRAFFADGSGANTIRLSFSLNEPEVVAQGIARLAKVIRASM